MSAVMKIIGFAAGVPCPMEGQYLQTFDFEACDGRGEGTFTPDLAKAMKFATKAEAMEFWRRSSQSRQTRYDGRPNRPLTASTIEIFDVEEPVT